MDNKIMELFHKLIEVRGIHFYECDIDGIELFDLGLRQKLFEDFNFNGIKQSIIDSEDNEILYLQDDFQMHYIFWKVKCLDSNDYRYYFIGPYLTESVSFDINEVIKRHHIPLLSFTQLQNFYFSITTISEKDSFEYEIPVLINYCFPEISYVNHSSSISSFSFESDSFQPSYRYGSEIDGSVIAQRYQDEDTLLTAIQHGNYEVAFKYMKILSKYTKEHRTPDLLREYKNFLIIHNSLFRKSVQNANVYPAHIDKLSDLYTRKIEAAKTKGDLTKIYEDMLRKYCLLVQNHSLLGYSTIIQNAINYIEFHLTEELSLKDIAQQLKVNSSYLSTLFKKETKTTITNYVNEKRISNSLVLLATTDLPIQKIAEYVGINDENYFSRIFKKTYLISAREYRKKISNK